jgi:hypothetical protein
MTNDLQAFEQGIARAGSIGGTAMPDAVAMAETYLS